MIIPSPLFSPMLEVVPPERITNRYPGLVLDLLSMAFSIGKIRGENEDG
jgi:hypothetical protein